MRLPVPAFVWSLANHMQVNEADFGTLCIFRDLFGKLAKEGPKGGAFEHVVLHGIRLRRHLADALPLRDYRCGLVLLDWDGMSTNGVVRLGDASICNLKGQFPVVSVHKGPDLALSDALGAMPSVLPLPVMWPVEKNPMAELLVFEEIVGEGLLLHVIQIKNTDSFCRNHDSGSTSCTRCTRMTSANLEEYKVTAAHMTSLLASAAKVEIARAQVTRILHSIVCPRNTRDHVTADVVGSELKEVSGLEKYSLELVYLDTPMQGLARMITSVAADVAPDLEAHDESQFTKHDTLTPFDLSVLACKDEATLRKAFPDGLPEAFTMCRDRCVAAVRKLDDLLHVWVFLRAKH
eukprot:TRINITY_DN33714_c0_g1_i1.p1 TRINITY_DN33714_c0_g1~~TRINITY_DN33714_c0_g1_i1.p1  ORF type:complete len:349 (+),score=32.00 TRINITY_DN33714_c0_g1_i1:1372-2418(+)